MRGDGECLTYGLLFLTGSKAGIGSCWPYLPPDLSIPIVLWAGKWTGHCEGTYVRGEL